MPNRIRRRTPAEDLEFKLNLMVNNPTELYLMVVRNECSLEDFAKLYLKVQGDWYLEEYAELFAKLILQDEAAATRETFRILDEIANGRDANFEAEYLEAMIEAEIDEAYEEHYWEVVEEEWRILEQTGREIREYMESDDFV